MKKFLNYFIVALLGIFFVLGSIPALCAAQQSASQEFTLEEITVTAEKRETNVQKTPITITAITGEDIASRNMTDVGKVLGEMAGVNLMGGSQGAKIFVRGIGSSIDTNSASSAVVLQQDNVYYGQSEAIANGLFDIARVEVLYGPQGTMYGKNAAGGVVNIITNNPKDSFESSANLSVGDYSLFSWGAVVNVPFSSKFAARLALSRQKHDGYISDGSGDANKFNTRVKLLYTPTDSFSVLFTNAYSDDKSSMANSVPVPGSEGNLYFMAPVWPTYPISTDLPASANNPDVGWDPASGDGWPLPFGGDAWTTDPIHPKPYNENKYATYSLEVNWDMGWSNLKLIPTMNKNTRTTVNDFINGIAMGALNGSGGFKETQYTGELDLTNGKDSPFIWTVGGYYFKSNNKQTNIISTDLGTTAADIWVNGRTGGPGGAPMDPYLSDAPITANYRVPQDSKAVFGQATYPITESFRLTGGFRMNTDNNNMKYRIIINNVTQDGIYGQGKNVGADGKLTSGTNAGSTYITDFYDQTDSNAPDGTTRHLYDTGVQTYTVNSSPHTYKAGLEYDLAKK